MEKEVGQKLFIRTPHGVELTDTGQHLLPVVTRVARDMNALDEYIKSLKTAQTQSITVLHCQIIHDRLWRTVLADYSKSRPDVEVRTIFGTFSDELDWPQADIYIVPQKRLATQYPPNTKHEILYHAWVHGIMYEAHPLAKHHYIDLDAMSPYPMLFPSFEFMETLGCWYWMYLREHPDQYNLEFHHGRTLHEIQLQLFGNHGIFISQGEHIDLAPGIVEVPFTPESPKVEEHICWHEDASAVVLDFVDILKNYYSVHSDIFDICCRLPNTHDKPSIEHPFSYQVPRDVHGRPKKATNSLEMHRIGTSQGT